VLYIKNLPQMKRNLLLLVVLVNSMMLSAQDAPKTEIKYRRSSLNMILLESESFPMKDVVLGSWGNYPFPSKYNNHNLDSRSISPEFMNLTDQELIANGYLKDTLRTPLEILKATAKLQGLRYLNADSSVATVLPSEKVMYQLKIDKILREKQIAKQMVSKWYSRNAKGELNTSLIEDRGLFAANSADVATANTAEGGVAILKEIGKELISNSFTTFTKIDFYENEPAARLVRDIAKRELAKKMATAPAIVVDKAMKLIDLAYEKAKDGYTLVSKTWLYQLDWNDTILNKLYDIWDKPAEFDNADFFKMKFVGSNYNTSTILFSKEGRTIEQMIDIALVRNIDNTFAKLQKEYDVFKPKVPILGIGPVTADIGMKEGLKGGEKFEVLEMIVDPKTGASEYKVVGKVKVDKKKVWDNQYNLNDGKEVALDKDGNPIPQLTATSFKGGGSKLYPGLLLKQVK
jgi:hypothetical protein